MKITITKDEAAKIIAQSIGVRYGEVELEIDGEPMNPRKFDLPELVNIVKNSKNLNPPNNWKIPAIKLVRQHAIQSRVDISLADAKWFVENI